MGRTGPSSDVVATPFPGVKSKIPSGVTPNSRGAGADGFWSHHAGGCNFLFCDGSARTLRPTIDRKVWYGLLTRDGGERIELEDE